VELGSEAALVDGGSTAVSGELYLLDPALLGAVDVHMQVPLLFQRAKVTLGDGSEAEAHVMSADQVRGKRRLHSGDWRNPRGAPGALRPAGPFVTWARKRFG
jgi:gamma-glutamylaminecyclotransferase